MIRFYQIVRPDRKEFELTREQKLAREMGRTSGHIEHVDGGFSAQRWGRTLHQEMIGIIFDPEFWYTEECWDQWIRAIVQSGLNGRINVPMGNQCMHWSREIAGPVYLTLRGLEKTISWKCEQTWLEEEAPAPECYCVTVVPAAKLQLLPANVTLQELPRYWSKQKELVRIYCRGWLHSFKANRETECRHDLIDMCHWQGRALELGCRAGYMAKTCKEKGYHLTWVGIDLDQSELTRSGPYVDLAVRADAGKPLPLSQDACFDRIVCADFLEHIPYPWETLSDLRSYVKPDGLLVASFPNVGHWAVVEDLLAGRWDEAPSGPLCVSHLRFGTKKSWGRWFEKSGWEVLQWQSEKLSLPGYWKDLIRHWPSLDLDSLETVRYRVLARPAD